MKILLVLFVVIVMVVGVPAQANATLLLRGKGESINGKYNLIYDSDLNITWYDYTYWASPWVQAMDWAEEFTVNFNGTSYDHWRLPSAVDDVKAVCGYNITSSEMGHLYYTELGNKPRFDSSFNEQPGWGLKNTGDFENLKKVKYWSGTPISEMPNVYYNFRFYDGLQDGDGRDFCYSIAVRDGDVAAMPEPGTLLLLGAGLAGTAIYRKRMKFSRLG